MSLDPLHDLPSDAPQPLCASLASRSTQDAMPRSDLRPSSVLSRYQVMQAAVGRTAPSPSASPLRHQVPLSNGSAAVLRSPKETTQGLMVPSGLAAGTDDLNPSHDRTLSEEEDQLLFESRRAMPRDKVSASLPNIFQTPPRKISHASLYRSNLTSEVWSSPNSSSPSPHRSPAVSGLGLSGLDVESFAPPSENPFQPSPLLLSRQSSTQDLLASDPFTASSRGPSPRWTQRDVSPPLIHLTPPTYLRSFPSETQPASPPFSPEQGLHDLGIARPHGSEYSLDQWIRQEQQRQRTEQEQAVPPVSAPGSVKHYPSQGDLRHGPSQGFAFPPTPETSPDPQHQPYAYQSLASLSHNSGRLSSDWESNSGGWNRSVSPFDSSFGLLQESADESRYLLVWEIPSTDPAAVKQAFTTLGDVRAILIKFLESHGAVILAFHDLRHAIDASRNLLRRHVKFNGTSTFVRVSFVSKSTVFQLSQSGQNFQHSLTSENDGVLMISMLGSAGRFSPLGLQATLGSFGDLRSFRVVGTTSRAFSAEFFDTRAASAAYHALHNRRVEESLLHLTFHAPPSSYSDSSALHAPSTRTDNEALYVHLASIAAERDAPLPVSPPMSSVALLGPTAAQGGPFDQAFLGRRGSTTSSFLPSNQPSSSARDRRVMSRTIEEHSDDEADALRSSSVPRYLAAGRRSSNVIGPDRSARSSTFNSNILSLSERHAVEHLSSSRSPSIGPPTPAGSTSDSLAFSWLSLDTQQQQQHDDERFSPSASQSSARARLPSTPTAILSSLALAQRSSPPTPGVEFISSPNQLVDRDDELRRRWETSSSRGSDQAILPAGARGVLNLLRTSDTPVGNQVDLDRISRGVETRTTVMIKDVPNKLSRDMLVAIIDSVCPSGFDFVYLRFDFKTKSNVGYAFVNFVSTNALWTFAHAKLGTRWNLFNSEKILTLSFANVQGRDSLVRKFQNSTVLLQREEWQPVLFDTAGRRIAFPAPNHSVQDPHNTSRATGLYHRGPLSLSPPPIERSASFSAFLERSSLY